MADEKNGDLSEEPEEELEPVPSAEEAGEEEALEEEPEEKAPPWKRVRDDLYRRQSKLEEAVNRGFAELRAVVQAQTQVPKTETPTSAATKDPVVTRLRLQQDPAAVIREVVKEELSETEVRVAEKLKGETRDGRAQDELKRDFPELESATHPFYEVVDRIFGELMKEGYPRSNQTALIAAKLADRERPELREKSLKDRRRKTTDLGTRTSIAEGSRLETGVPKPTKKSKDELPELNRLDHQLGKIWKRNLGDEKEAAWIRQEKKRLQGLRIAPPREEEED